MSYSLEFKATALKEWRKLDIAIHRDEGDKRDKTLIRNDFGLTQKSLWFMPILCVFAALRETVSTVIPRIPFIPVKCLCLAPVRCALSRRQGAKKTLTAIHRDEGDKRDKTFNRNDFWFNPKSLWFPGLCGFA